MQHDTFLQRLLELRARAKNGTLQGVERAEYEAAKEAFARMVCE